MGSHTNDQTSVLTNYDYYNVDDYHNNEYDDVHNYDEKDNDETFLLYTSEKDWRGLDDM